MSYLPYVVAGYAAFAIALAWDFIAPRLQLRGLLRAIRLRSARKNAKNRNP